MIVISYKFSSIWSESLPRMDKGIESWITSKEGKKLQELIKGSDTYLEIGTHQGYSARLASEVVNTVFTIDKLDNEHIQKLLKETNNIIFLNGISEELSSEIEDDSLDVLFIDGCHLLPEVGLDYELYKLKVKVGGLIIFHDYRIRYEVDTIVRIIDKNQYRIHGIFESLVWFVKGDKIEPKQ